jgi:hypothetical protein
MLRLLPKVFLWKNATTIEDKFTKRCLTDLIENVLIPFWAGNNLEYD